MTDSATSLPAVHPSIAAARSALANKETTALELLNHSMSRIERDNHRLGAVIAINPEARKAASTQDTQPAAGALAGIPILIKDNIETLDPMPTTAGSLALEPNETGRDAPVVAALREAGATIVGKTNLSEWANFRSTASTSGWSAVGGQARNAYDDSLSPWGSSSGSAIAVATGMALGALGTETNGSIIFPASANGIVGFKPSVGSLSTRHIVPISHTQDTAGPMTQTVRDAALMLGVMTGREYDVKNLDPSEMHLGVLNSTAAFHSEAKALLGRLIRRITEEGSQVETGIEFEKTKGLMAAEMTRLCYEFKANLNSYLADLPTPCRQFDLEGLIQFNRRHAESELIHFGQELFEASAATTNLEANAYREALQFSDRIARKGIDSLLLDWRVDALIGITGPLPPRIDWVHGDPPMNGHIPGHAAIAGYPHLTLPLGQIEALPIGLSIIGPAGQDELVLRIGHAMESLIG